MTGFGYRLVGGRLLPAGDGVAGQFMYENPGGLRLTLFLVSGPARDETAFRYVEETGVSVFYWRDAGVEIGRTSWRGRGCRYGWFSGGAGAIKKNTKIIMRY